MPGAVHAAFVRSSHAHAMISIDTAAAKAMPGVLLVLTGEDWAAARLGVLPCVWQIRSSDGSPMREALCEVLARDRALVMSLGRIVETGPAEEGFRNPQHPYTR